MNPRKTQAAGAFLEARLVLAGVMVAGVLLAGCGRKVASSDGPAGPAKAATVTASSMAIPQTQVAAAAATPVTQPVLIAWQEGDKAGAINYFVAADWNARPVFPAGMALNLTDAQFQALTDADRRLKNHELLAQLDLVKQVAAAVAGAGRQAAANGDPAQARKCFAALEQFGAALDAPARMQLVQLVGQVSKSMANAGLARLGP